MRYNKVQLEIAEYIIKSIKDNDSCMDINLLKYDLQAKYGYEKGYDRAMIVMDFLEEDGVIEYWGKRYVKLTDKGSKMADKGIARTEKDRNFWEGTMRKKTVLELLVAALVIGGFLKDLLVWLFKLIFR